jgi:hypothetical protein
MAAANGAAVTRVRCVDDFLLYAAYKVEIPKYHPYTFKIALSDLNRGHCD